MFAEQMGGYGRTRPGRVLHSSGDREEAREHGSRIMREGAEPTIDFAAGIRDAARPLPQAQQIGSWVRSTGPLSGRHLESAARLSSPFLHARQGLRRIRSMRSPPRIAARVFAVASRGLMTVKFEL